MYDARDLANLMLDLADERSFSLGNLDLNRLLFFLNGNYLSEFGCDLVDDDFVACADGPKIRNVFNAFSSSGARIVGCRAMRFDPFKEEYFYVQYSFPVAIVDWAVIRARIRITNVHRHFVREFLSRITKACFRSQLYQAQ